MDRQQIELVRSMVSCASVLVAAGFQLDQRESSRQALKFRRGGEIVIVTHDGAGWFDPLSDNKGDVFALAGLLDRVPFNVSVERVGGLAGVDCPPGFSPPRLWIRRGARPLIERWDGRPAFVLNSAAGRYLSNERALPPALLKVAARADIVRQGPQGSTWFRHEDGDGGLTGWEERGPKWRGFSSGGAKTLFRFGKPTSPRVCVTEAAIDALSLAAIERQRLDTLYASTGGGWSPSTVEAIKAIAAGAMLLAATDADPQGEVYADRLRHIADCAGCDFIRLRPRASDWNEELTGKTE
ncbi:conserved hypothetical protein (plasmid) [Rhizobium leguminosarum bv. trifolii WSM2304]|uniref:DUF3991 domain-containing protein n=1 Tax=Rhizobium leguminosarum bv. trifolii (strain WSM2304) TaxID=395492 RepID=A0ABF7QZI8_RHILW|nr:DUF3991 and toprim domain-containing protein [Rhizobium leguminosarum]ACI59560.1 conserved hypothetical protein [Rhizobium leguminosarum bv. trifolii WSM2304]